ALVAAARFRDDAARVRHRDELTRERETNLRRRPSAEWLAAFAEAGVPAAEIKDVAEVLSSEQAGALGAVQELRHPSAGAYRVVARRFGSIASRSPTPCRRPSSAPTRAASFTSSASPTVRSTVS